MTEGKEKVKADILGFFSEVMYVLLWFTATRVFF